MKKRGGDDDDGKRSMGHGRVLMRWSKLSIRERIKCGQALTVVSDDHLDGHVYVRAYWKRRGSVRTRRRNEIGWTCAG